jgi:alkylation response protein AidB-like acyl-CoA dehydrogenase
MGFTRGEFNRDFSRAMGKKGWIGMTWPKQYGGHERTSFERYVVIEEMLVAGAPLSAHYTGDRQSGPNMLRFGTEEQKNHFLPRIAAGELTFCIGMSEPNSGSDLAGTRTRAVKVDGGYRINGTKLWTSNAHRADYAILFCKMSGDGKEEPDRHAGATQFLLDLKTPGIDIRPVINLLGEHHFNEIFLTDVFVPDDRLLGQEGNGWNQVTSELSFERSAPDRFLVLFQMLREMIRMAGPDPDRATAAALGKLIAQLATLRSMSISIAGMLEEGLNPNNESAVVKDLGTRYEQDIPVVARQLFPTEPELEAIDLYASMIARATMNAPRFSIQGGTREILRGIIARGLGLR